MRTTLTAALLCFATLVLPGADGQRTDIKALLKEFPEHKAKAEQGDAEAQHKLGNYYRNGLGVERNLTEAARWYRKAAEQNHAEAQLRLGQSYCDGEGVETNLTAMVEWYRKAAEQNHASAQFHLGACYLVGRGVAKDYAEAMKWTRKAAEQNNDSGQYNLGVIYQQGYGVEKDYSEAYAWHNLALAGQTHKVLAETRDKLEKKMSPEEVVAGKKRTEELRTQIEAKRKGGGK